VSHEVVRTTGGALAIRSVEDGEVMHPGVGPLVEAEALYVRQSRLAERLRVGPVVLFDVGLGAGSNALAARAEAERSGGRLELVSFERDLGALALALEHGPDFGMDGPAMAAVRQLLAHGQHVSPHVAWRLARGDLLEGLARETSAADVIFWDPFSPRVNPELWTVEAFAQARARAAPRATLFTYSASTAVRAAMLLGGWTVGVGDPIGTKRQTTAAAVEVADLARPLPPSWPRRLSPELQARLSALRQFRRGG
jgi:queuine tRNA-ribosyltransferase